MAKVVRKDWMKRRWLDFRQGHSVYLIFVIQFAQFVIISYTLAIERFAFLEAIFPNIMTWILVFIFTYLPSSVLIGHIHRKHQLAVEIKQQTDVNPFNYSSLPGKEKIFSIPSSMTGLQISNETMRITNDIADGIETLFNTINEKDNLGLSPLQIKRYPKDLALQNQKWIYLSHGLVNGGDIRKLEDEWNTNHREEVQ